MTTYVVEHGLRDDETDQLLIDFVRLNHPDGVPFSLLKQAVKEIYLGFKFLEKKKAENYPKNAPISPATIIVRSPPNGPPRFCILYPESSLALLFPSDPNAKFSALGVILAEMAYGKFLPHDIDRQNFRGNLVQLFGEKLRTSRDLSVNLLPTSLEHIADPELIQAETDPKKEDRKHLRGVFYVRKTGIPDPQLKTLPREVVNLIWNVASRDN